MSKKHSGKYWDKTRDDITGEHNIGDAGQLILFIAFMAVWITDAFIFKYSTLLNDYIPLYVRIPVGVIILLVAAYMARTGLNIVFGTVRENPHVIRTGIFGIVRHPIYLSEILLYLGLLFLSISLVAAGVWLVIICFLHRISKYEEKLLLERFGDEYRQYMKDVPMYFPRIFGKKKSP